MNSTIGDGLAPIIAQAIEEIKREQGESFSLDKINLADLERRTGVSRAKLRRLKENRFVVKPHSSSGRSVPATVLTGYLNPNTVYNHFKEIVKRIGAPELRFHDMRHSYAVASLQIGDDVKTVQSNLGHATAAFTLDVYGHVTDQMKEESANRMERFIHIVKGACGPEKAA